MWTISAGNAGQGVAYAARQFGIPCTVVAIETAPQTKLDRMRALGATIVPVSYDRAWVAAEAHEFAGLDGTFVHPFDNHDFIAGHGTMGLEILEDLPGRAHRHLRDRRRRADHRRRQRDQGAAAGREGARRRAGDRGALCSVPARRRAAQVRRLAGVVRRRRRRQERHRAHVAADAAGDRRRDHRHAGPDARRDAPDRREIADDCRRRGRVVARRCACGKRSKARSSASCRAAISTSASSPSL